jgi:hypothetical protein
VRWKKVVVGALLGGLLGFGGQLVADFLYVDREDRPPHERTFTMYQVASGQADVNFRVWMRGIRIDRARPLIYQGLILAWLMHRGDIASRTALIVAFLGASAALALDWMGKDNGVKSSSKQTTEAKTVSTFRNDSSNSHQSVDAQLVSANLQQILP